MLIIGHRGARAHEPENTLRALRLGMKCADYVEVDVRLSRDGVPVAVHDATVDRTTDGEGAVRDLTLRELKTLDAGCGAEVPTLCEVLDCVRGQCGLFVEIKERDGVEGICRLLGENGPDNLFVVSFDADTVKRAGDLIPEAKTGLIVSETNPDPVEAALALGADAVLPRFDLAERALVDRAHRHHLLVFVWTLNTPDAWERACAIGADGVASDDPCAAREYLQGVRTHHTVSPSF
ncbi:glycerophosphodiester phosphodiesterase [Methanofollis tationis]|uniref:Glycerophosphodiester phosphodiesterase n=1 Tax=Methanofollis tationis TaxID=81417 RepID=A0A7K4HKR3_9EURY|nr:glycerophosphodiester phosphodiesterase [Methanofollis tationis]NVO65866.1 glycerophosphodiester phosphodiesterase [Methanofollis tationis]